MGDDPFADGRAALRSGGPASRPRGGGCYSGACALWARRIGAGGGVRNDSCARFERPGGARPGQRLSHVRARGRAQGSVIGSAGCGASIESHSKDPLGALHPSRGEARPRAGGIGNHRRFYAPGRGAHAARAPPTRGRAPQGHPSAFHYRSGARDRAPGHGHTGGNK